MYLTHFGLDKTVFDDGIARDESVFLCTADRAALKHAEMALACRDSVIVLHGPPGTGKTVFAATAIGATAESSRVATAWLGTPGIGPYEMLELLLVDFGFDPYKQTRVERLQTWRQFLIEMSATDTRIFVAVEHADELEPGVIKALAALTAADPNGCPGANVVLMGQDRLIDQLNSPELAELKQRVRLTRRFAPYDDATLQQYLEHAVRAAGGEFDSVFGAGAVATLRAHSGGIPRVVNHVAETALALTASRRAGRVTAGLVRTAAVEICGLADLDPAGGIDADGATREASATGFPGFPGFSGLPASPDFPDHPEVPQPPPDEIPVLTEQVDVDIDAENVELDATPGGGLASPPQDASPFDALSPELVDAILSGDDVPPDAGEAAGRADGFDETIAHEPGRDEVEAAVLGIRVRANVA